MLYLPQNQQETHTNTRYQNLYTVGQAQILLQTPYFTTGFRTTNSPQATPRPAYRRNQPWFPMMLLLPLPLLPFRNLRTLSWKLSWTGSPHRLPGSPHSTLKAGKHGSGPMGLLVLTCLSVWPPWSV